LGVSASLTKVVPPKWRFTFLLFDVRMWRRYALDRFTFPVAVFLNRLAAPLCVLSFGIIPQKLLLVLVPDLSDKTALA